MKLMTKKAFWQLPLLVFALTFSQVSRAQEFVVPRHTELVADATMQLLMTRLTDALSLITTGAFRGNEERLQRESVRAMCFYVNFNEYKDVYLSLLETTPLDLSKIAGADNFGRYLAQVDRDSNLLETFVPSIRNTVQTEIENRRHATPNLWTNHPRTLNIMINNIHDRDFGDAINHCKAREYIDAVIAHLPPPTSDSASYDVAAPLEFVNWEHTNNGGVRPVFRNPNVQTVEGLIRQISTPITFRNALMQISGGGR